MSMPPLGGGVQPPPPLSAEPLAMPQGAPVFDPYPIPDPIDGAIGSRLSKTSKETYGVEGKGRKELLEAVGKKLTKALSASVERRSARDERLSGFRDVLEMEPPDDRFLPLGDDSANVRTGLTWKRRSALHAYLLQAVVGIRPFIKTEAPPGTEADIANRIEQFYDTLYTNTINLRKVLDTAILGSLDEGTAFLKPCWDRRVGVVMACERLTEENAESFGFTFDPVRGGFVKGDIVRPPGAFYYGPCEKAFRDAPNVECISYYDAIIVPADAQSVDDASIVGHKFYSTLDNLRQMARSGVYDPDQVKLLEDSKGLREITSENKTNLNPFQDSEEQYPSDSDIGDDGEERDSVGGTQRILELVELVFRADMDGDDMEEDWFGVLETSTGTILRCQRYALTPGVRPLRPVVTFVRPKRLYGQALPEILSALQYESDESANLILDRGTMANTVIIEESASVRSPLDTSDLRAGLNKITVDKAGEGFLVHPLLATNIGDIFPSRELVESEAADITAANETMIGSVSDSGSQTAFETNQALVGGGRRLQVNIDRVQDAVKELHGLVHAMMCAHFTMESGGNPDYAIEFLATPYHGEGEPSPQSLTLQEFLSPVTFYPLGDGMNTDRALNLQAAEKLALLAERHPMFQGEQKQHAVLSFFLNAYGVRNVQDFIGSKEEAIRRDKEAEQRQQTDPFAQVGPLDPKVNPEMLAYILAQHPDVAQQVIPMLQQVYTAQGKGGANNDLELQEQDAEHAIELKIKELEHMIEMAKVKMQADQQVEGEKMRGKIADADRELGLIHSDAKMKAESFRANQQAQLRVDEANQKVRELTEKARAARKTSGGR